MIATPQLATPIPASWSYRNRRALTKIPRTTYRFQRSKGLGLTSYSPARSAGRDGVVPARVERMAAREPFDAEPATAQEAVPLDGLPRVLGARGVEAAARGQRTRDRELVEADEGCGGGRHGGAAPAPVDVVGGAARVVMCSSRRRARASNWSTASPSSANDALAAGGRAT